MIIIGSLKKETPQLYIEGGRKNPKGIGDASPHYIDSKIPLYNLKYQHYQSGKNHGIQIEKQST
jgi:hypothetical protein